mgnify:CR=1 FL=1
MPWKQNVVFGLHKTYVMTRILKELCVFIIVFLICPSVTSAAISTTGAKNQVAVTSEFDWSRVIDAIMVVESNGNPSAKRGNSVGAMQITPILVAECNNILKSRRSKKRYRLSDRYNVTKSKEMFLLIQSKFNPMNDIERAIRSWNGGIHYSISRTQRYYERVIAAMKK